MFTEKPKILVVDDEPDIVDVLRDFLVKKGYGVVGALSGEEALSILDKKKTDLVLLDLKMPGLKGTDAARIIKKKYPSIKVTVLTGYPDMGEDLLHEHILDAIFTKPIRMKELSNQLLNILSDKEEEDIDLKQRHITRTFLITARLLFVESSVEIYNLIKTHFMQLSKKGEHFLSDVAGNEIQIVEKLKMFEPDIVFVNASFLKKYDRDKILDLIGKNSGCKEVLVYNIGNVKECDERKLDRLTKNLELTCFFHGLI